VDRSGHVGKCRVKSGHGSFRAEQVGVYRDRSGQVWKSLGHVESCRDKSFVTVSDRCGQVGTCRGKSGHVGTCWDISGPVVTRRDRSFGTGRDRSEQVGTGRYMFDHVWTGRYRS